MSEIIVKDIRINAVEVDTQDYNGYAQSKRWKSIFNYNFNYGEFATFRSKSEVNNLSIKKFVAKTNAIGLQTKARHYDGTYAHTDIAFSSKFKIYLVKEFWSAKREKENIISLPFPLHKRV